jgi:signal transduction histidine kinase
MHERAALVGATVQIESAPGEGTTIFVRMPTIPATTIEHA